MTHNAINEVWIVSLHDRSPQGYLAIDVSDIVECIYSQLSDCQWMVFDLDCTGNPIEEGVPITASEFQSRSRGLVQTIEGKFIAYAGPCPEVNKVRRDYSWFPQSLAKAAIVAVDSSYFEVFSKDPEVIRRLKERFTDVREEDARKYFLFNDGDQTL